MSDSGHRGEREGQNADVNWFHYCVHQRLGLPHCLCVRPKTKYPFQRLQWQSSSSRFSLDETSNRIVPTSLRPYFFHLCHCSLLIRHSAEGRVYDSMRKKLPCPHTVNDFYSTVRHCSSCVQSHKHGKRQLQLKLFFPKSALKYMGMDILGPLLRTKPGNQIVVRDDQALYYTEKVDIYCKDKRYCSSSPLPQTLDGELLYHTRTTNQQLPSVRINILCGWV